MEAIYQTKFKKPIYEGDVYVAVLKDLSIITTTASANQPEDPDVLERFLTKAGALKLVKNSTAKGVASKPAPKAAPKQPVKTEEELNEERLSNLSVFKQLLEVKSEDDWKKWLKRNSITINTTANNLTVAKGVNNLITFGWAVGNVAYCCGGKELGSHTGGVQLDVQNYSENVMKILATYLAPIFDARLLSDYSGYGLITYVRNINDPSHASGRLGYIFDKSKYLTKVTTFENRNSHNVLALYAVNDVFSGKGDDLLSDEEED